MRADVALTPANLSPDNLCGQSAVVIDVFRASTTVIAAMANGCRMRGFLDIPAGEADNKGLSLHDA